MLVASVPNVLGMFIFEKELWGKKSGDEKSFMMFLFMVMSLLLLLLMAKFVLFVNSFLNSFCAGTVNIEYHLMKRF